jgi:hypothetical protein
MSIGVARFGVYAGVVAVTVTVDHATFSALGFGVVVVAGVAAAALPVALPFWPLRPAIVAAA